MADLKESERDDAEFAYGIFKDADDLLDSTNLGTLMRCLNLNPSLETLEKLGASKKKGDKKFKLDECLTIYSDMKKEKKEQGCFEDFIECLKLYDKNENGKMLAGELTHSLLVLAEKLTDAEVDELMEDCLDEEDDEGEIDYIPFLRRMCGLDPPIPPAKPAKKAA